MEVTEERMEVIENVKEWAIGYTDEAEEADPTLDTEGRARWCIDHVMGLHHPLMTAMDRVLTEKGGRPFRGYNLDFNPCTWLGEPNLDHDEMEQAAQRLMSDMVQVTRATMGIKKAIRGQG